MKIETVYKGTCVLLGICFITMIGYNVGVSKGEETDTPKGVIPDMWDLTKPKVEWIELEYIGYEVRPSGISGWDIGYRIEVRNTLNYSILIMVGEAQMGSPDYYQRYGSYHPIWFLNTTEGWQYRASHIFAVSTYGAIHCLLPNSTAILKLHFWTYPYSVTQEAIYYEAYIESEHTIVKGVCEIPNITP